MYLYSILRHPMFDVDMNMRAKIILEKHSSNNINTFKRAGWNWLYFIQMKNILESLKSKTYRKEKISSHFAKYFAWFNSKEKLKIRKSEKKMLLSKFQSILHDNQMVDILSEKFQIDLDELKIENNRDD